MQCPTADELYRCVIGDLPESTIDSVYEHAEQCSACGDLLESFDDAGDIVISALRGDVEEEGLSEACSRLLTSSVAIVCDSTADYQSAPVEPQPLRLRGYQLLQPIGQGGMGTLYRAKHEQHGRVVAIKLLTARRMEQLSARKRFRREMDSISRLEHPNIVRAIDAGEQQGVQYLVMELIDGLDVRRLLKHSTSISVSDACEIVRQAAIGLHEAHQQGFVHRDVKPSNLMVDSTGQVKVLDLGLALFSGDATELTAAQTAIGSINYMAPEQANDSHSVDARADVYSLGCTLYQLLSGVLPHTGNECATIAQKIAAHATKDVVPVGELQPDVPQPLCELVRRMLARSAADRPPTAASIAEALAPLCEGADLAALVERARDGYVSRELYETDEELLAERRHSVNVGCENRTRLRIALTASLLVVAVCAAGYLLIDHLSLGSAKSISRAHDPKEATTNPRVQPAAKKKSEPALPPPLPRRLVIERPKDELPENVLRDVTCDDYGRHIHILETKDKGIAITVTETVDGMQQTRKFEAASEQELLAQNSDAYMFYVKHTGRYAWLDIFIEVDGKQIHINEARGLEVVMVITENDDGEPRTTVRRGRNSFDVENKYPELAGLYARCYSALSDKRPRTEPVGSRCLVHGHSGMKLRNFVIDEGDRRYRISETGLGFLIVRVSDLHDDFNSQQIQAAEFAELKRQHADAARLYLRYSTLHDQVNVRE